MLISFSVANFRSFGEEQTLSLVASNKHSGNHDNHKVNIPESSEGALKAAVIYGANGAGKSNLFKALVFMKRMVTTTRDKQAPTGREAFRFTDHDPAPSYFDIQFIYNDTCYRYFIKVDDSSITEEYLAKISRGKESVIYERITPGDGSVKIETPGLERSEKAAVLATVGGPPNQTFLATVKATLAAKDVNIHIRNTIDWFLTTLTLIAPEESIEPVGHMLSDESGFLAFAGNFLKHASTGVDNLIVDKTAITEEELFIHLRDPSMRQLVKDLGSDEGSSIIFEIGRSNQEILVERKDTNNFYQISVRTAHTRADSRQMILRLDDESDGTKRLLQLIPALYRASRKNTVYFIDEIDRSMHPMLIRDFIEKFISSCELCTSQIIIITHETHLLDLELFRRDEIWFVEKDHMASSHLYSLAEFKVRKDLEVRKNYLQGRFGAVPFLGSVDRLVEEDA
jgi:AAA15 family ATPase/GTPase